jgi:hypothetical protein
MCAPVWPHLRDPVTVVDVLEDGACISGVIDWLNHHGGLIFAPPSDFPREQHIQRAARADGYGNGYGDGNGNGYGNGNGNGNWYWDGVL